MTPVIKKKRYLLLVIVSAFVVLVVLSPFLLSSSAVLHFVTTAVNKNISGRLSVGSWLIGWQQGILCQDVVYTNPEKGISVSAPSLTSNRGLLAFVLAPKNLGVVHIDSPVVELSGAAVQTFFAAGNRAASETGAGKRAAREETPVWDQVVVDLQARDGQVKIDWEEQDILFDFNNVSVDSTLAAGIAAFEIGFQTPEQGFVGASGTLNLPAHEDGWLETIIAETEVKISSLQLRRLLRAGAAVSLSPQGEGELNADFKLKVVGLDGIEYSGLAEVTDCVLNGGFLGDDQPSFQKVHLAVEAGMWTSRGWRIKGLELASDTLSVNASGEVLPDSVQLSAQGIVNLPVLFDQIPRLLNVNESTFVESGIVDFTVDLAGKPDPALKIKAQANGIGGIFHDKRFSWDAPVAVLFNGKKSGSGFQISALQFDAPFARAKGSGDLHSFVMDTVLDLDKAFADIGILFNVDLTGSGKMEMTVKSILEEKERFKVDTDLSISDFMLRRHDQQIIPRHQFSMIGSFKAPDTLVDQSEGELDIQIALSSWFGEVFLVMNGEKFPGVPFKGYYTTDSELDLAPVTTLLHAMNILDSETRMAGTMQMQAAGFAGETQVELRDLSAESTNFRIEGNGALFTEPRIRLKILQPVNEDVSFLSLRELKVVADKEAFFRDRGVLNLIDFSAHTVSLHNVQLTAESLTAKVDRLMVPDWRKPDGIKAQFSLAADLGKLTTGFQAAGVIPSDVFFSGTSQTAFHLAERSSSVQEMRLDVQIADFGLQYRNSGLIVPEDVVFSSVLLGQVPSGAMAVEELTLRSGILDLAATGEVSNTDAGRLLELSGSMKPALDKVALLIGREFDLDLIMQGRPEEKISVRYPLGSKPGDGSEQSAVFSSIHADSLVADGIEILDLALPFHFDSGKLHMEASGRMDGGRFELVTDTDFTADPAVVKTPGNSQVMTGVKLNDSLVRVLLSRMHPLLGGLAQPSGLIDARLDSFWWPIGEGGADKANFVAILDAREIRLESKVPLENILAVFGLEKETLQLRDNEIYCTGSNGRVKCSPVRVMAGDNEMTVGGSVSMDGSLDYEVEVPITKKLVSEEGYAVLRGTTVKVPVKGTIDNPVFDKETVMTSIRSMMKQAADQIVNKGTGQDKPL